MVRESNNRFVVVAISDGIWYTLQTDENLHTFFENAPKTFKCMGWAIKAANKVSRRYLIDRVCVFRTELDERLSSDAYDKWIKDEERVIINYETI